MWLSTRQLPKIEDLSSLATIFEQSLFFGGSLGRVGVDFRAVLIVHFEDHVFDVMTQKWRCACRDFEDTLRAHSLGGGTGFSSSRTPIVMASFRHGSANGHTPQLLPRHSASNEDDYSPPRQLMAFPILAEFTNALLTSLNELRLCTIASLQNRLARKFQGTLCAMLLSIADFCEANKLVLYEQLTSNDDEHSDSKAQNTKAQALTESIRSMNQVDNSRYDELCRPTDPLFTGNPERVYPVHDQVFLSSVPHEPRRSIEFPFICDQPPCERSAADRILRRDHAGIKADRSVAC